MILSPLQPDSLHTSITSGYTEPRILPTLHTCFLPRTCYPCFPKKKTPHGNPNDNISLGGNCFPREINISVKKIKYFYLVYFIYYKRMRTVDITKVDRPPMKKICHGGRVKTHTFLTTTKNMKP